MRAVSVSDIINKMKATVRGKGPVVGGMEMRKGPGADHLIQGGKTNIVHLQKLESYRRSAKLALNENNMKNINTSLALQEVSFKNFQKRQAQGKLFCEYRHNPFSIEPEQSDEVILNKKKNKKDVGLVEAINTIRKSRSPYSFDTKKSVSKRLMNLHQHECNNRDKSVTKIHKKDRTESEGEVVNEKEGDKKDRLQQELEELDMIMKYPEKSFFREEVNKKDINIFNAVYLPSMIQYGFERLARQHFETSSVIKTTDSTHFNLQFQQICTEARMISLDSRHISKEDIKDQKGKQFDYGNITFEDLLKVAHGRLTPLMLEQKGVRDDGLSDFFQDFGQDNLSYRPNSIHQMTLKTMEGNEGIDDKQIQRFRAQPYTDKEQHQLELSEQFMKKIQDLLKRQERCRRHSVRDKKLMKGFDVQKDEWLWNQTLEIDKRDSGQRVRMGKLLKDRCQNIRNKAVLSTLITRKVYQRSMRGPNSKQMMNMTTWR